MRRISQTIGTPSLMEWAKLALEDLGAPVLRVVRVRQADGFGALYEKIVLSSRHFPDLTTADAIPDIADLAERYGLSLGKASERISFVSVPADVAEHLGIEAGTGVVKLDRITETRNGEPVEWRVAYALK